MAKPNNTHRTCKATHFFMIPTCAFLFIITSASGWVQASSLEPCTPQDKQRILELKKWKDILRGDGDMESRAEAVSVLASMGKAGHEEVIKPLFDALDRKSNDESVRVAAADALAGMGVRASFAFRGVAQTSVQDENEHVRAAAWNCLNSIKAPPKDIAKVFCEIVAGKEAVAARVRACDAITKMDLRFIETAKTLAVGLRNKEVEIRRAAANALCTFGIEGMAAIPALKAALADTDAEVCNAAKSAIRSIDKDEAAKEPPTHTGGPEPESRPVAPVESRPVMPNPNLTPKRPSTVKDLVKAVLADADTPTTTATATVENAKGDGEAIVHLRMQLVRPDHVEANAYHDAVRLALKLCMASEDFEIEIDFIRVSILDARGRILTTKSIHWDDIHPYFGASEFDRRKMADWWSKITR